MLEAIIEEILEFILGRQTTGCAGLEYCDAILPLAIETQPVVSQLFSKLFELYPLSCRQAISSTGKDHPDY